MRSPHPRFAPFNQLREGEAISSWPQSLRTVPLVGGLLALVLLMGCVPEPASVQSAGLLDQLVLARAMFGEQPPRVEPACNVVGDVQTRLYGEPGLSDVRSVWPALRDAAQALQSVCGQNTLLGQPTNDALALAQARQRWEQGIQREIGIACDHLRDAAVALSRTTPC